MGAIFVSWVISGVVLIGLAILAGLLATSRIDGILIDERGRYSLTHLQLCLWTIVIISLISGVFFGRLVHGVPSPQNIDIPADVLGLFGISAGSAVASTAVKRTKDTTNPASVAASGGRNYPPKLAQIFLVEEGTFANGAVDVGKFQQFVVTLAVVVTYVALAAHAIEVAGTASAVTAIPDITGPFLVLLGISHGAYVTGKLPTSAGKPSGLVVSDRNADPSTYRIMKRAASAALPRS
jgi:hypothetical protein